MDMRTCPRGHFYDGDIHATCPVCERERKGWLIYANGELRGAAFPIYSGRNDVGRTEGDVRLSEDGKVSQKEHCVISYDVIKNEFYIIPRKPNMVMINNKPVIKSSLLKDGDKLCIGETKLIFRIQKCVEQEEVEWVYID